MLDKRKFYINGKWVDPIKKNDFDVINPCNEDPFAVISLGSKEDTDLAVKSAKNAFDTWKETSKKERLSLLEKLSSVYKKRFNEMAEAISLEMGAQLALEGLIPRMDVHPRPPLLSADAGIACIESDMMVQVQP